METSEGPCRRERSSINNLDQCSIFQGHALHRNVVSRYPASPQHQQGFGKRPKGGLREEGPLVSCRQPFQVLGNQKKYLKMSFGGSPLCTVLNISVFAVLSSAAGSGVYAGADGRHVWGCHGTLCALVRIAVTVETPKKERGRSPGYLWVSFNRILVQVT